MTNLIEGLEQCKMLKNIKNTQFFKENVENCNFQRKITIFLNTDY